MAHAVPWKEVCRSLLVAAMVSFVVAFFARLSIRALQLGLSETAEWIPGFQQLQL